MTMCPGCKKEHNRWKYPTTELADGSIWHLYCYHTQSSSEWHKSLGDGTSRPMTPEEVTAHFEWAKASYKEPK